MKNYPENSPDTYEFSQSSRNFACPLGRVVDLLNRHVDSDSLAEQQIASLMAEPFRCCCRCRGSVCVAP